MKNAQIGKILKLCRQNHVKKIKIDQIEVEFYEEAREEQPVLQGVGNTIAATTSNVPELRAVSEDEMLFWSTPFYDALRSDRKKDESA